MAVKKQRGGSHKEHVEAGRKGGEATAEKHGPEFYSKIGEKGGKRSPTQFKPGDERTKEAAEKGGKH